MPPPPATETLPGASRPTALPPLERFKPRGGPPRRSRRGPWRAAALIAVHVAVLIHIAHWQISGSTLSPVEPSEAMQTLELGYINAGFLLFCVLILLTLVLGRFFCGWACHVVAYQDLCAWLLGRLGVRPRPVRSRLLALVPLYWAFHMFVLPTLERWYYGRPNPELTWHLTTTDFWETFPGPVVSGLTFLVCGFLVVYWLGAKGFCTYGCPYGAIFGLSERVAPGRIRVTDACETCGHCTATCTSNVRVHEEVARHGMVVDPGCMKCMDCVNVCPKNALYFGFGKPGVTVPKTERRRPRADFSWGEELLMATAFVLALLAFRGLYAVIPLLLSIGLAVLIAIFTIIGWRLLRRRELLFQHRLLKTEDRLTRTGWLATTALLVVFALTAHSLTMQICTRVGEFHAHWGANRKLSDASSTGHLLKSQILLERAERWGLHPDPRVHRLLGLVLRERTRLLPPGESPAPLFSAAEQHLRTALELHPGWPEATVPLTDLLMMRGERTEAETLLRELLERHPHLRPALQRLERLERGR